MGRTVRFDFDNDLARLRDNQNEREHFLRSMGEYANRSDSQLLSDITGTCDDCRDRDKEACRLGLSRLAGRSGFNRRKMAKRINRVIAAMDADPPRRHRRRSSGFLLRGLVLLFLLRGLSRRR
ncbi:MAG: hypothetical protein ACOX47_13245 [Bacillota bacterium]|jgi:hypothetical protein